MPSIPRREDSQHGMPGAVSRPELAIWQPLESERIRWEGQVQIVGQGGDLPALLVITRQRLALIGNGEITLEFPLAWMKPAPRLIAENGVRLFISPGSGEDTAQPMLLRARAGRGAAMEIVAVLAGKTFASREASVPLHIPAWKPNIGAAAPMALPSISIEKSSILCSSKPVWPPVEVSGVSNAAASKTESASSSSGQPSWRYGSTGSAPKPVPAGVSRAARKQGTDRDNYTVSDKTGTGTTASKHGGRARKLVFPVWAMNLAVVMFLVAGLGYVAHDQGYELDDMKMIVPGNIAGYLGIDRSSTLLTIDDAADLAMDEESGIKPGGDNRLLPVINTTASADDGEEDADPQTPQATSGIGGGAANAPVIADADADDGESEESDVPPATSEVAEETVAETVDDDPVDAATEATEDSEQEDSSEAVVVATAVEELVDPTVPLTPEVAETPEPTVAPTQTVALIQSASVASGTVPNQEFVEGGIRYSIDAVSTGASIAELPEINNVGKTWVIITLTGANTSSETRPFDMQDFYLIADGAAIPLDTGTGWVSSLLGNDPAYGYLDTGSWMPREQHQFSLTFLAPADVSDLVLIAGTQRIPLDASITNSVGLREIGRDTAPAAKVSGQVIEVIDGQTITVDVNGELITVRYLGIEAPTGAACYANEATLINASMVEGQTVTLERQSVDTNARGVWVRDVWVANANGDQVLVGQALVADGAAVSKVSEPNSRYAEWLNSTESAAQDTGIGLWSACGN